MNCPHCGKKRPYSWVGGQHCHAPNKTRAVGWPYLLEGRIPTDWIEESRAQVTNGDEEPPRPQYSTQTSAPYYKTQDYTYTYEDDE